MSSLFKTILITVITIIFGAALVYEIYLIPQTEKEIALAIETIDKEVGSDTRAKKIEQIQNTYQDELSVVDQTILSKEDLVALIEELEGLGRGLGLITSISSITNDSKNSSGTNPETVRIAIDGRGSWASSLTFVKLLENLPYKYNIDKMELFFDGTDWRTNSTIKLTTYPNK